jgi:hypothetical protein
MSTTKSSIDPANVIEGLVYTLLDVFDATRDLYKTLRIKERRDHEDIKRRKGYPPSPPGDHLDEETAAGNASIVLDKAAVKREFSNGVDALGPQFAVGDVITQASVQSQVITLQSVIIDIFLYGPTSQNPISQQLSTLLAASRAAGTASVDALAAQRHRMLSILPPSVRPIATPASPPATPYPASIAGSTGPKSRQLDYPAAPATPTSITPSIHSPSFSRPRAARSDTESTSFSGLTSSGAPTAPQTLYCPYALDLQRHPSKPLAASITSNPNPYCPDCDRSLHLSPGKAWEIFKDSPDGERKFRIQNRFIVKCHRRGADQGYSCVLCNQSSDVDTVCGDVKALVRHIWIEHGAAELKAEEDIFEVIERMVPRRGRSKSDASFWKETVQRARSP